MSEETKVCTKCGEEKALSRFYKDRKQSSGLKPSCKSCNNKKRQEWYEKNKEDVDTKTQAWRERNWEHYKERQRQWRDNNKDYLREQRQKYKEENKEHVKKVHRQYYEENFFLIKEKNRKYRENNRESVNQKAREWRKRNREHVREYDRYCYRPSRESKKYNLRVMMKDLIKRSLVGSKNGSASEILGYSTEDLEKRLEYQFEEGMSWFNRHLWHVDHKIPIDRFYEKGETRPHIINALSNLQPLWAEDNLQKSNKLGFS